MTEAPRRLSVAEFRAAVEETSMPDAPVRTLQDLVRDDPASLRPQLDVPMLSRMVVD